MDSANKETSPKSDEEFKAVWTRMQKSKKIKSFEPISKPDKELQAVLARMQRLKVKHPGPPTSSFFKAHLSPTEELAQLREDLHRTKMEAVQNENMAALLKKENLQLCHNFVAEKKKFKKTILKLQNEKWALYNENDDLKAVMKEVLPMKNELLEMKERAQVQERQAASFNHAYQDFSALLDEFNAKLDEIFKKLYQL